MRERVASRPSQCAFWIVDVVTAPVLNASRRQVSKLLELISPTSGCSSGQGELPPPRVHLLAANATALPFADSSFDIVFSCGMLEHIGVAEGCTPGYWVSPLPRQTELRHRFLAESIRVLRPDGILYSDHPNGRFPIDFWHNDYRSLPRFHRPGERFLPSFDEVAELARSIAPNCSVEAISPAGRFTFQRSRRRWYGKMFTGTLKTYFALLGHRPFSHLAASSLNPYLVVRITK